MFDRTIILKRTTGMIRSVAASRCLRFAIRILSRMTRQQICGRFAERVLGRSSAVIEYGKYVHAPDQSQTFVTQRNATTLAPSVQINLQIAGRAEIAKLRPSLATSTASPVRACPNKESIVTAPQSLVESVVPGLACTDRIIARFEPALTNAVAAVRHSTPADAATSGTLPRLIQQKRVDTVFRNTRIEIDGDVRSKSDDQVAANTLRAATRTNPTAQWAPPKREQAISDSQVSRITEQVVQQINRKIVAKRERMGRV